MLVYVNSFSRTTSLRKKITFLSIIYGLSILIISAIFIYGSNNSINLFKQSVNYNTTLIEQAMHLRELIIDAETGQRGYIITGNDEFLEPYKNANNKFRTVNSFIRKNIATDTVAHQLLDSIEFYKYLWIEKAGAPEIQLRQLVSQSEVSIKSLNQVIAGGLGKSILDSIRLEQEKLENILRKKAQYKHLALVTELGRAVIDTETGQRGFMLAGKYEFLEPYHFGKAAFRSKLRELKQIFKSRKTEYHHLIQVEKLYSNWLRRAADPEIEARVQYEKNPRSLEDLSDLLSKKTGKLIIDKLRILTTDLIQYLENKNLENLESAEYQTSLFNYLFYIILVVFLSINVFITIVISKSIVQSMDSLLRGTKRLSQGDFTHKIHVNSSDEFLELSKAFNHMSQELKSSNKQIIETKKLASLGHLTAGLAHEINQPLGAILLTSKSLLKSVQNKAFDKIARYSQRVYDQVKKIDAIISQLTQYSRVNETVEINAVYVNEICSNVLNTLSEKLTTTHTEVKTRLKEDLPVVYINKIELERVLINILNNALHALSNVEFPQIKVATRTNNDKVEISITDNGCGMPKHVHEKIFDPFFTTKAVGEGTGLGLALSKEIINRANGELKCESEKDVGTTFEILLPIKIIGNFDEKNLSDR